MIISIEFLGSILNTLAEQIVVINRGGDILFTNQSWIDFGKNNNAPSENWTSINYLNTCDISAAEGDLDAIKAADGIRKVIQNELDTFYLEYPCHSPNEKRWFTMRIKPFRLQNSTYYLISHHNITERKLAEEILQVKDLLLQQQSRLAALGEMIGNIAHQWRQPLGAISAIAGSIIVSKELEIELDPDTIVIQMNHIDDQVQYLSKTIDDFRNYLKNDHEKTIFNISDMLNDSINIAKAGNESNSILISTDFDRNITCHGLKNILAQVILNLLSNARDALIQNEIENKKITLSLQKSENIIVIKVKDNGGGVPDEIKNKIFDPYFTTKHQSQGTGLGLFMSSQIIQKNFSGHLSVSNVQDLDGMGACFTVEFSDTQKLESKKSLIWASR